MEPFLGVLALGDIAHNDDDLLPMQGDQTRFEEHLVALHGQGKLDRHHRVAFTNAGDRLFDVPAGFGRNQILNSPAGKFLPRPQKSGKFGAAIIQD